MCNGLIPAVNFVSFLSVWLTSPNHISTLDWGCLSWTFWITYKTRHMFPHSRLMYVYARIKKNMKAILQLPVLHHSPLQATAVNMSEEREQNAAKLTGKQTKVGRTHIVCILYNTSCITYIIHYLCVSMHKRTFGVFQFALLEYLAVSMLNVSLCKRAEL